MEPRTMTTTNGVTFTTTLTDIEAAAVCNRIPQDQHDHNFARQLAVEFHRNGRVSANKTPYMHLMAVRQLGREGSPPQLGQPTRQRRVTDPVGIAGSVQAAPQTVQFTDEQREYAASLEPMMFFYDIPTASKLPNPSPQLWRIGARINLSCWVIPKGNIPYNLMGRIIEAGGSVHTIPFAKEAADKLLDLIANSLTRETAAALDRTQESMQHAAEKGSRRVAEKGIEAARKRVQKHLGDLQASARVFGLSLSALPMHQALAKAHVLQAEAYEKARQYRLAGGALKQLQTADAAGVSRAIEAGQEVPVNVMGDVLIEGGNEDAANELMESFRPIEPINWE